MFSGLQPTGNLHLGNYLGAIKNWVELQERFQPSIFCVVDLHAITVPQNPEMLKKSIIDTVAAYIACGIDVDKSMVFVQSSVAEHLKLSWLLGCLTPMGRMNRMTQFKDKTKKNRSLASLGLYSYPVLMAADILLYKSTYVPVGHDQMQHIELTRDIANSFNSLYSVDYFPLPEAVSPELNSRVMSLKDGNAKMSKSDPADYSRINLFDEPDVIKKKIAKAKTDSISGFDLDELEDRPEARNLIEIYSNLSGKSVESVCNENNNFTILKSRLTDLIILLLKEIQEKFKQLQEDRGYIDQVLKNGRKRAQKIAYLNFEEIKNITGIYN
ncbi:MAG: tryptophan--tRNA ligase [Rickettsiaceae bacterium H1]|nr:tryptophan--tRNA ligase [Rickettsiaceae bacterium H1]